MQQKLTVAQQLMEITPIYLQGNFNVLYDDWYFNNIVVGYVKFYLITDGECMIIINGEEHVARAGMLFLLPFNATQTLYITAGNTVTKYWFHCTLPCQKKDFTELVRLPYYVYVGDDLYVEGLFRKILSYEKDTKLTAKLDQKADILRLLSFYIRLSEVTTPRVNDDSRMSLITSYIDEHLSSTISIKALSGLLHFHPNYFIRFFKEMTGYTPLEYINNQRIDLAKTLLLNGNAIIQDVASQTGFNRTDYFARCFRKKTGFTPTEYQRVAIQKHTSQGIAYYKYAKLPDKDSENRG